MDDAAPAPTAVPIADLLMALIGLHHRPALTLPGWIACNPLVLLSLGEAQVASELRLSLPRARRIVAACEFHQRLQQARIPTRPRLPTPEDVVQVLAPLCGKDHERFWCLPMDTRMRLIGEPIEVTRGDIDGTDAGPRAFFRNALRAGATSVVAAHNHPTGVVDPSPADLAVTRRLAAAGRTVDCPLQDHVIVVPGGGFTSLRRDNPDLFR